MIIYAIIFLAGKLHGQVLPLKGRLKKPTLEKIGMLSDGGVTPPSPFLLIKNPAQKQCFWLKITLSGGEILCWSYPPNGRTTGPSLMT